MLLDAEESAADDGRGRGAAAEESASGTDAKVLAGAISSFAREGRRMNVTAIGAGSINQAVKAIAIARKNVRRRDAPRTPRGGDARARIPALSPLAPLTPLLVPPAGGGGGDRPDV